MYRTIKIHTQSKRTKKTRLIPISKVLIEILIGLLHLNLFTESKLTTPGNEFHLFRKILAIFIVNFTELFDSSNCRELCRCLYFNFAALVNGPISGHTLTAMMSSNYG